MTEEGLIIVTVGGNPDAEHLATVRDHMRELDLDQEFVVTDNIHEIYEVPALDEYTEELAERVAHKIANEW